MKPLNDLFISVIVAIVAWIAYKKFGATPALGILVIATIAFVWWNFRRGSGEQ